jgi:Ca-activated chloride channel family protein
MNHMITFAEPFWFLVGVVTLVLLVFLYKEMHRRRVKELARFASSNLLGKLCANVSGTRRTMKKTLLLVAIACCFVALARPQYGVKWVEVKRKGIDILFAVDTSKSMLAEDVRPNRLQRAKYGILDFVGQLEGDRVGLMPFAGSAFLMCPLTIDYSAFESSLEALDTEIIPKGGTDLAVAIEEAEAVLSNEANHKILVLITDGENLQGDAMQAAKAAAEKGMTIYTVGVGTREGELIPISRDGKTGFVKDESGKFITSQLDESSLSKIAELTSGLYVPLGVSGEGLQAIYKEKLSLIPKEEIAEKRHKIPLERFIWPLAAALVFLMVEFLVGGRKSKRSLGIPFVKTAGRRKQKLTAILLFCCILPLSNTAKASPGEDAYEAGDFLTASQFYSEALTKSPNDPMLHYNYGTVAYKNNLFEDAAKSFSEALKSDDLLLQERAYYNRGNALFQRGHESLQTDQQNTMELWQQAVDSYEGALQLNSMNKDASYNLTLAKKKLEELKKQEEEQKKQDQKDQEQKDDQKKKDDKKQDQGKDQGKDQKQDQGDKGNEKNNEIQEGKQGEDQKDSRSQQSPEEKEKDSQEAKKDFAEQAEPQEAESAEKSGEKEAQEQQAQQAQQAQEQKARDQKRRSLGKMTSEEAMQLLNSLKDKEGELNFVPASLHEENKNQQTTKDW